MCRCGLMRIQATGKERGESLRRSLVEFGESSGLFESIDVSWFGDSTGGPFQLQVKMRGREANVVDVGYGVSQILPILVQIFDPPKGRRSFIGLSRSTFFLLQQPEVHLHPRAQAELSSLLTKVAGEGRQSFIVETHSDYMIDRARI